MRELELFQRSFLVGLALILVVACEKASEPVRAPAALETPVTERSEWRGDDWPSFGGNWDETHYSPLRQIHDGNLERLGLAWYVDLPVRFSSGVSSPVAAEGVLYFAVGQSFIHAVDAKSGKLLWNHDPKVSEHGGRELRGAWGVRGIAYAHGRVYSGTADGRLIALDADSGELLWSVATTEENDGRYITGMPYVIGDNVIIGHGGADFSPVRAYVTAYDRITGEQAWRFHTVPGNPADGFENEAMALAAQTWTGEWWRYGGGGTVWNAMAYDLELNAVYIGVGNGAPVNHKIRSPEGGDNLFLNAIVALDADSGDYLWHYQTTPGDTWDFTSTMDIQLAELEIDGRARQVILHAPKNGFFYVIDRSDGELISAEPFARITWAERVDLETGRPVEVPGARFPNGSVFLAYPSLWGAHGVEAMSYNPNTGLVYLPARDKGHYFTQPENLDSWSFSPDASSVFINQGLGAAPVGLAPPPSDSWLAAWDPVGQREVWRVALDHTHNGGTLTTAGNLVMQGRASGEISIYAADAGQKLWSFDARNGIMGNPITYLADGEQYISLLVGWRASTYGEGELHWDYRSQQRRLLTFKLNGNASLPDVRQEPPQIVDIADFVVDADKAEAGRTLYHRTCHICHGGGLRSGGAAPSLIHSPLAGNSEGFTQVLREGLLAPVGMPRYEELTDPQIESLLHYIRAVARERRGKME